MSHEWIGIIAGVLELASAPIYIWSIVKGRTKPDRVTWWILTLVSGMITLSYFASGARETIWLPLVYTLTFGISAVLSLKYGDGPVTLSILDRVSLVAALVSAALWWIIKSPVPSLFMNICTEFAGIVPTMNKAYRRPWTESPAPWVIGTVAAFLNLLAITEWTIVIASYPVYIFLTNIIITAFVLKRQKV